MISEVLKFLEKIFRGKNKRNDEKKRPFRILFLADEEDPHYSNAEGKDVMEGIDLVICCGDLNKAYMDLICLKAHCDTLFVNGNHHGHDEIPGCISIEDKIVVYNGIRILGLGGSIEYNKGPFQYTEKQMTERVKNLRKALSKNDGFDILVTHAPAFGLNDGTDPCHIGFKVFNVLLDKYKPKYFVHGHLHKNYGKYQRITMHNGTTVINAYKSYILEYND